MRYRNFLLPVALASVVGCSLLLNADPDQCERDGDCLTFGQGYACLAGECKKTAVVEAGEDAGTDAAPDATQDTFTPCSPQQCAALTEPSICSPTTRQCEKLIADGCKLVLGTTSDSKEAFKDPNALLIAAVVPQAERDLAPAMVFELAVSEMNEKTHSLPAWIDDGGIAGPSRPVALLLCDPVGFSDSQLANGLAAAKHVFGRLGIQAMIWHLGPVELSNVWQAVADDAGAFIINAGGHTRSLATVRNDRIWHMLPSVQGIADFYGPAIQRMEAKARELSDAGPVRLATITSTYSLHAELYEELANSPNVTVNGTGLRADSGAQLFIANEQNVVDKLYEFRPHIVVSTVGDELVPIVADLQSKLEDLAYAENADAGIATSPQERLPRYLFSPFNADEVHLKNLATGAIGYVQLFFLQHLAGVNVTPLDTLLKEGFAQRLDVHFPNVPIGDGGLDASEAGTAGDNPRTRDAKQSENLYDAAYFAFYSIVAASAATQTARPTGTAIGDGMRRLQKGASTQVGALLLPSAFDALRSGGSVSLNGILGPPKFDLGTRAKDLLFGVFCVKPGSNAAYVLDVLRLTDGGASDAGTDADSAEAGVLVGDWAGKCQGNTAL